LYKYGTCGATPPYGTFGRDRWLGREILAEPGPINADARPAFPE
jgi:hypothetical protein